MRRAASYDEKSQTWGFFVQDDWRVSSRLTVNLGLRYEFETPLSEAQQPERARLRHERRRSRWRRRRARDYALNPTPEVPVSEFNVRGGLTFAGVDGQPSGLYETPKNNFMPRVGLAYKLDEARRCCAPATGCSTASSASAAATSSRAASARTPTSSRRSTTA